MNFLRLLVAGLSCTLARAEPEEPTTHALLDISWRENTSATCLASEVWSHELDAARLVYFYALAECVSALQGQPAGTPSESLTTTTCGRCARDFIRICDANGGGVSTVDLVFGDEENSIEVLKKYRFYECIPAECAVTATDVDVFTRDWIEDLSIEFDIVQANFAFDPPVAVPAVDILAHNQTDSDACQATNEFSQECVLAVSALHDESSSSELVDIRNTYTAFRNQQRAGVCTCHTLPFDVGGGFILSEAACICDTHARELERECLADAENRRFCYYTISFRGGPTRRYNYTYFECIPAECDNPFDRYGLEHAFYEDVSRQNAFHPVDARFESYCYEEEGSTPFVFSDDCAVDTVDIRDASSSVDASSSPAYNISYEDAYLDAVVECIDGALNTEPRKRIVSATCTSLLESYSEVCANADRLMCENILRFDKTANRTFGLQSFEISIYQCVSRTCDNDFDRAVFDNRDVWLFDGALGVEANEVDIEWKCAEAPTNAGGLAPSSARRDAAFDVAHVLLEMFVACSVISAKYM